MLDIALGIGGLPKGRVVEIYGPGILGQDHADAADDRPMPEARRHRRLHRRRTRARPDLRAKLGVNVDDLLVSQPDTGEQALEIADMLVRSNAVDMVVIDSVAALTPKAEIEGEMGDQLPGLQARLMSQALRKLTGNIKRSNCMVIFINQLRMKIGVMMPGQSPEVTTGGNALKFYASVRLDIRRIGAIKKGEEIIGNQTKIKVVKNKMAPPFKQVITEILYGEGISREGELIDMGVEAQARRQGRRLVQLRRRAHRPGQGERPPVPQGQPAGRRQAGSGVAREVRAAVGSPEPEAVEEDAEIDRLASGLASFHRMVEAGPSVSRDAGD